MNRPTTSRRTEPQRQRRTVDAILRDSYERFGGDKETRIAVNAVLRLRGKSPT